MSYTVGIVGASGAVGQELLKVLERRSSEGKGLPVQTVRLFGSSRSAGTKVESAVFGSLVVELFQLQLVRESCQVVFLAVSGSFALEHAKNLCAGDDGPVVIDNSVSTCSTCSTYCTEGLPVLCLGFVLV
jgi:aspartate-semialdehyde dehydrogenase